MQLPSSSEECLDSWKFVKKRRTGSTDNGSRSSSPVVLPSIPSQNFKYFSQQSSVASLESRVRQLEQDKLELGCGLQRMEEEKTVELEVYKKRIEVLERELKYMTETEATASRRLATRQSSPDGDISKLKGNIPCQPSRDEIVVQLGKKLAESDSQITRLQNDICILREQLLDSRSNCDNYEAQSQLANRQRLEQIDSTKSMSDELTEAKQKLADTLAELNQVRSVSQIGLIMSNSLDQLTKLKSENAKLKKDNAHYKLLSFNTQLLDEEKQTLEDQNSALEKQRDDLLSRKCAVDKFLIGNQADVRDMTSRDLRNVDSLGSYCKRLHEANSDLEKRLEQAVTAEQQAVAEREAIIAELRQTVSNLKSRLCQLNDTFCQERFQLTTSVEELKYQLEELENSFQQEREDWVNRTNDMEMTMSEQNTTLGNLEEKLHSVETESHTKATELTMCQAMIDQLQMAIKSTSIKYKTGTSDCPFPTSGSSVDSATESPSISKLEPVDGQVDGQPGETIGGIHADDDEDCSAKDMEMTTLSVEVTAVNNDLQLPELGSPLERSPRSASSSFAQSPLQRNLHRELIAAYAEIGELKTELATVQATADNTNAASTSYQIYHAVENPLSMARKRMRMDYINLKTENKKLLLRLEELEKIVKKPRGSSSFVFGNSASSAGDQDDSLDPQCANDNLNLTMKVSERQSLEAKDEEISGLSKKIAEMEARNSKLREMQKAVTDEYRSTVTQLVGYQVKICGKRTSRDPSVYEVVSRFDKSGGRFRFQLTPDGNLELLDNDYVKSWPGFIDKYLRRLNSIPAFMSAITLDFIGASLPGVDEDTFDEANSTVSVTRSNGSSSVMEMEQTSTLD